MLRLEVVTKGDQGALGVGRSFGQELGTGQEGPAVTVNAVFLKQVDKAWRVLEGSGCCVRNGLGQGRWGWGGSGEATLWSCWGCMAGWAQSGAMGR